MHDDLDLLIWEFIAPPKGKRTYKDRIKALYAWYLYLKIYKHTHARITMAHIYDTDGKWHDMVGLSRLYAYVNPPWQLDPLTYTYSVPIEKFIAIIGERMLAHVGNKPCRKEHAHFVQGLKKKIKEIGRIKAGG